MADEGNEYLDFLREREAAKTTRLRGTATMTMGVDPDAAARAHNAATYLGVPAQAARAAPEETARAARLKALDEDTAGTPTLRTSYTDADFSRLASDDSGVLSRVESSIRGFFAPKPVPAYSEEAFQGAVRAGR